MPQSIIAAMSYAMNRVAGSELRQTLLAIAVAPIRYASTASARRLPEVRSVSASSI
jgi:hypothetical protein